MSKGKFAKSRGLRVSKSVSLVLALVLLVGCVIGGTVEWLTANTDEVKNTFTKSTVGVDLEETEVEEYKMIPGWTIEKDPKAWVTEGSEEAILFVEIKESENFDDFMTYAIASGWNLLNGTEGAAINTVENDTYVIYRVVEEADIAKEFAILAENKVTVKTDVTEEDFDVDKGFVEPTLTFTAYAHQLYKDNTTTFTAAEAWENLD